MGMRLMLILRSTLGYDFQQLPTINLNDDRYTSANKPTG